MRRAYRTRLWALTIVLCLALIFSLSLGYILVHAEHHCQGEHCPVCEHMTVCLHTILGFCDEWLVLSAAAVACILVTLLKIRIGFFDGIRTTPVLQHNRINC